MDHWRPEVVYSNQFAYTTSYGIISDLRLSLLFGGYVRTGSDVNELSAHCGPERGITPNGRK